MASAAAVFGPETIWGPVVAGCALLLLMSLIWLVLRRREAANPEPLLRFRESDSSQESDSDQDSSNSEDNDAGMRGVSGDPEGVGVPEGAGEDGEGEEKWGEEEEQVASVVAEPQGRACEGEEATKSKDQATAGKDFHQGLYAHDA